MEDPRDINPNDSPNNGPDLNVISLNDRLENDIPHDADAEQALLGALLYDNEIYHRVSSIIKPQHFYIGANEKIFAAIAQLIEQGRLADAIILKNRFAKDKILDDIGGVEYLALLLDNAPPGSTAPEYAKLVFDMAMRRELIRLSDDMKTLATDPASDDDAKAQIIAAETKLYNLAAGCF